jgi:hypothetical protein
MFINSLLHESRRNTTTLCQKAQDLHPVPFGGQPTPDEIDRRRVSNEVGSLGALKILWRQPRLGAPFRNRNRQLFDLHGVG